jgi:hypothetical protein
MDDATLIGRSSSGHLRIERSDPPPWLADGSHAVDDERWRELGGEQAEWGYAIPQMYRILASPAAGHDLLRAPREGDGHFVATAYWSALLHLLTYSFGWIRPERGLLGWHHYGDPTDDTRLQMLAQMSEGGRR